MSVKMATLFTHLIKNTKSIDLANNIAEASIFFLDASIFFFPDISPFPPFTPILTLKDT
jgi:hypothetical protein